MLTDLLRRFGKVLLRTPFVLLVRGFELLGIVVAVVALIYGIIEFRQDRVLREATLMVMFSEQMDNIREWLKNGDQDSRRAQIVAREIIERMVTLGMKLDWLDASDLNLNKATFRGANFAHAELKRASLVKADLRKAELRRADLREAKLQAAKLMEADFTEAILRRVNFGKADLTNAKFNDADITGAKLKHAVGLTQSQLASACVTRLRGQSGPEIPDGLRWSNRKCSRIVLP